MRRIIYILTSVLVISSCVQHVSRTEAEQVHKELSAGYERIYHKVIQPAEGYLQYPYLIPAGFYKQTWDWDGFFMGCWFIQKGKPEYMKYWALNFLAGVEDNGYVVGCMTTKGPRKMHGSFAMKPFLSQGVARACEALGDYEWVRPHYDKLVKVLAYRDSVQLDPEYNLYFWENAFQSGADNNPALNYFAQDGRSYLATDCSIMQMQEFRSQAAIASALGYEEDAALYTAKAEAVSEAVNEYLWCEEDKIYYNMDRELKTLYKRVSYSSFWPLAVGLASQKDGREMIRSYLLSEEHMLSPYGLRSLSRSDPEFNNRNIIRPFSNWQGPVWAPATCVYVEAMDIYGFKKEQLDVLVPLAKLMLDDVYTHETMHENYHSETGEGLAPATTKVDENGKFIGFISWNLCVESLLERALAY